MSLHFSELACSPALPQTIALLVLFAAVTLPARVRAQSSSLSWSPSLAVSPDASVPPAWSSSSSSSPSAASPSAASSSAPLASTSPASSPPASSARTTPAASPPAPHPEERSFFDRRSQYVWDRMEFTMGFIAGERRYALSNFIPEAGAAVRAPLNEPFRTAPFDGVPVLGLRYELRLVVSYLRLTAGLDLPFPAYSSEPRTYTIGGTDHEVRVQSVNPYEMHFGIGGELPIGPVAPFLDVLGGVHWVRATVLVDGARADLLATSFAFSLRAGVRLQVRRWFFASLAGEAGLYGDVVWGTDLSVGFSTP